MKTKQDRRRIAYVRAAQSLAMTDEEHECPAKRCFSCEARKFLMQGYSDLETNKINGAQLAEMAESVGRAVYFEVAMPSGYEENDIIDAKLNADFADKLGYPERAKFFRFMSNFYGEAITLMNAMRKEAGERKPIDAQDPAKN